MMFPVILVVIGLFHATTGDILPFCISNTTHHVSMDDNMYFQLNVDISHTGSYSLNTFYKFSSYNGKLSVCGVLPLVPKRKLFPVYCYKRMRRPCFMNAEIIEFTDHVLKPLMYIYTLLRRV